MRFIIISKCSFCKQERHYTGGGQVVISAPVSWERGGGDITGRDNLFHHHFQMQLLQTRADIFKGAGSNICPLLAGNGVVGTVQAGTMHYIIISKCSFCKQEWTGSNLCPCWLGIVWWGQYRLGQCVTSSFPNAASTNKSGHIQGVAGSNLCPYWQGMGWWGQYRPGQKKFLCTNIGISHQLFRVDMI